MLGLAELKAVSAHGDALVKLTLFWKFAAVGQYAIPPFNAKNLYTVVFNNSIEIFLKITSPVFT